MHNSRELEDQQADNKESSPSPALYVQTAVESAANRRVFLYRWRFPLILLGALIWTVFAWVSGSLGGADMTAINQGRIDRALDPPQPGSPLRFIFTPNKPGLNRIDLTLVNFDQHSPTSQGNAIITLYNQQGEVLTRRQFSSAQTAHNEGITLHFAPVDPLRDGRLTLEMTGEESNTLSMWGYSLDVWPEGRLVTADPIAKTPALKVGYRFQWTASNLSTVLGDLIGRFGLVLLVGLFFIPLPGVLLQHWLPIGGADWPTRIATSYALGLSLWALLWYWLTLLTPNQAVGFTGRSLWIITIIGWLIVLIVSIGHRIKHLASNRAPSPSLETGETGETGGTGGRPAVTKHWPLIIILTATLLLRLLAVRDLAFLPWVDSSHHALITAIMAESGRFIETYQPYLPVERLPYHYGIYPISSGLALMLAERVTLPDLLLGLMQLLSTLTSLGVYAGAIWLTGRRPVGWLAAFLVGIPFLFPAYYTTWGRITQIGGLIILPILIGLLWHMAEGRTASYSYGPEEGAGITGRLKSNFPLWLYAGLLAAGLFMIHARVFLYFLPFAVVLGIYLLLQVGKEHGWTRLLGPVLAGATALLLTLPRLLYLQGDNSGVELNVGVISSGTNYLRFPSGYLSVGWETRFWLFLALCGGLILLRWVVSRRSDQRGGDGTKRATQIILFLGWFGLLYLAVAGPGLHPSWPLLLPQTNLNSAYITLFAPQAILLGIGTLFLIDELTARHWLGQLAAYIGLGLVLGAATLFGINNQLTILNETTLLAFEEDVAGLAWIDANLPADALVAHSSWRWLQTTWAGSDGGAWITPLTGRMSSTPPIDHSYGREIFKRTRELNGVLNEVEDWSDPAALAPLQAAGFTHIYVGPKGGYFDPAALLRNPAVTESYAGERVWVFEILP